MKTTLRSGLVGLTLFTALAGLSDASFAATEISVSYPPSSEKAAPDSTPLFSRYLGTAHGTIVGNIEGEISWDLYEDQTSDDFHPAHFIGVLRQDGKTIPLQIIGLYTPKSPTTRTEWKLVGSLSIDDLDVLPQGQVPIVGFVDIPNRKAVITIVGDDHE